MRRILAVGLVASASWCGPALADWQDTRWGMSVDEVIDVTGGNVAKPEKPETFEGGMLRHLLSGTYSTKNHTFVTKFIFDNNESLAEVRLSLLDTKNCDLLRGELANTYGPPRTSTGNFMEIAKWWDETNGNVVIIFQIGDLCELNYQPYKPTNAPGGL